MRASATRDNQYTLTSSKDTVYGVGFEWRPTERTNVVGKWEHRFFGSSYLFSFDHRTPLTDLERPGLAQHHDLSAAARRRCRQAPMWRASSTSCSCRAFPIRSRASRRSTSSSAIAACPQTLTSPVTLYAQQIVLQQQQSATVGLVGARNTHLLLRFQRYAASPSPPRARRCRRCSRSATTIRRPAAASSGRNRLTQAVNLVATLTCLPHGGQCTVDELATNQGTAQMTLIDAAVGAHRPGSSAPATRR